MEPLAGAAVVSVMVAVMLGAYALYQVGGFSTAGLARQRLTTLFGGRTIAEREDTCIIYGMPRSALEAGVADRAIPLPRIADEILAAL